MNCSECQDLLDSYALEALDANQAAQVRAHLQAGCDECVAELAEIEAALAQLPLSLDPVAPPAAVRTRLLERTAAAHGPRATNVSPLPFPALLRRRWIEPLIAAAAAAAITAGIFWGKLDRQQRQLDAVRDELFHQEARVDQLQAGLESEGNSIRMFASPAVQLVSLDGSPQQPTAKARVFWDKDRNLFHLYAAGLKKLAPGKTYEMWFINSEKQKLPAGTFLLSSHGEGSLVGKPPPDAGSVVALAVTDEPEGGSNQPTGQIQLLGQTH
jgi:anti-sigma-K factor RskA